MTTTDPPSEDLTAPAVVAVVVTHNPGPWLEDALAAFAVQDYPNFAVLIVDAASTRDPLPRVAKVLPDAYLRRLGHNPGYAAATNRALRVVQGASHFVLCHDDVAPEPDAIRLMVEEAFRQNAGIVMPKQLDWARPELLRSMGGTADRTAATIPLIEPGEYDQGQHDAPREIFAASGGCLLVRSDLFETLGGFDAGMTLFGEDLDFSWRAQLAGARIVTAPAARVRHLEAASRGLRATELIGADEPDPTFRPVPAIDELILRRRHRLRTALKVRSGFAALTALLAMAVLTIAELFYSVVTGRGGRVGALSAAWVWNFTHWRELVRARRSLRKVRSVDDAQTRSRLGSVRQRLAGVARRDWQDRAERLHREGFASREVVVLMRNLTLGVAATILAVWSIGSRGLIMDALPAVGGFVPLPDSPMTSVRMFFGIVPDEAFGDAVFASPVHLIGALSSVLVLGNSELALKLLAFGAVAMGIWGASRIARPLGSTRARLATIAAYAAVPLPYDAFGLGRLDLLVVYGAAPWVLNRLLRTLATSPYMSRRSSDRLRMRFRQENIVDEDLEAIDFSSPQVGARATSVNELLDALSTESSGSPFDSSGDSLGEQSSARAASAVSETGRNLVAFAVLRRIVPLSLLIALVGAFTSAVFFVVLLTAALLFVGSVLSGSVSNSVGERAERVLLLVTSVAACATALVLLSPSLASTSGGLSAVFTSLVGGSGEHPSSFLQLFEFDISGTSSLLTLGLLVAGAPGLLFGRDWRLRLSIHLWVVTIGSALVAWFVARGSPGVEVDISLFLPVIAIAVALNIGVGVHAITVDLRAYTFGWRQLMPFIAVIGIVVAFIPVSHRGGNGTWGLPELSTVELLSSVGDNTQDGSFRWMWLGDPAAIPGESSRLGNVGIAITTDEAVPSGPSTHSSGDVSDASTEQAGPEQKGVERAVLSALDAGTVRIGQMLAPYNIRYIAVPNATGALGSRQIDIPPPDGLVAALGAQLDLRLFQPEASVAVFENTAWIPVRSSLSPEATLGARQPVDDGTLETAGTLETNSGATAVLDRVDDNTWAGDVPPGEVFVGQTASDAWTLRIDGQRASRQLAFGWASTFAVGDGGRAVLSYSPPLRVPIVQSAVVLAWLLLAGLAFKYRTRRGRYT